MPTRRQIRRSIVELNSDTIREIPPNIIAESANTNINEDIGEDFTLNLRTIQDRLVNEISEQGTRSFISLRGFGTIDTPRRSPTHGEIDNAIQHSIEDIRIISDAELEIAEQCMINDSSNTGVYPFYLTTATINQRQSLINLYLREEFRHLRNKSEKVAKKKTLSKDILLAETNLPPNKDEKVIFIKNVGYFLDNDSRLVKDILADDEFIINDTKYYSTYNVIYNDIDSSGNLIVEGYSSYNINYNINNRLQEIVLPRIITTNYKLYREEYFKVNLLDNNIFNYKFKEDFYNDSLFRSKEEVKPFEKKLKTQYRKHKCDVGLFFDSIKDKPNTFINTFGKKYSFGLEIETISGYLPRYLDNFLYYSAVHDGSLREADGSGPFGGEYVTDILKGDLGLKQLKRLCYELSRRCLVDKRCGE